MAGQGKTSVALVWHMHQPLYRDLSQVYPPALYRFPWVRLHAIRDYFSMALIAESVPDLHLTINVTPCLLWQIEDYVERGAIDRALLFSLKPAEALDSGEREEVMSTFFDADLHNEILNHERYSELLNLRSQGGRFTRISAIFKCGSTWPGLATSFEAAISCSLTAIEFFKGGIKSQPTGKRKCF